MMKWQAGMLLVVSMSSVFAGGCAISSPHWDYVPESISAPIPFQAWATSSANPVVLECANDTSAHGWPTAGDASYVHVTNLSLSSAPSLDPAGSAVYSASAKVALPAQCWKYFGDYDFWQANVRIWQLNNGSKTMFTSFDEPGLECLGREIGKARSWLGFFDKCEKRYLNSDDKIPYIVLRIDGYANGTDGAAPQPAPRRLPLPAADERVRDLPAVQQITPVPDSVKADMRKRIKPL
jgi:hypothetical protein